MKVTVAILAADFDPAQVEKLKSALQTDGAKCTIIREIDRREALRQVMDLDPAQYALCIFCDNDGRSISSLSTALDPKIAAIGWCQAASNPDHLATLLNDVPVLLSFAESPAMLAQLVRPFIFGAKPMGNESGRPQALPPATAPKQSGTPAANRTFADDEDHAVYQQLETMMAAPVKEVARQQPVQVQQPGLDFSTPLRKLMSDGRNLAQKNSSPEILGAHYLATLEEPFAGRLAEAGVTRQLVDDYLSGFASGEDIETDPTVSDEAFDAVSRAKVRTRERQGSCIQTADFLSALLAQPDGSVADIISDGGISQDALDNAIAELDGIKEPCASPFFAPSSLDQDSFYEFDPAQVRSVEQRLRVLPGFQKAAARVAEARQAHPGGSAAAPAPVIASVPVAAEPPEKPEIIKVSADFPSVDDVEHIADSLLEGQLVAFPADIMYAIAADAANPIAIDRLRQAAELPPDKPLSILINSTSQLKHLVRADLDALEPLLDELWPGPLTLVFKAAGTIARHVSSGGTVAIRQPGDNTSLAVLSMLGRPLAVTSWDATPPNEPVDTAALTEQLAGKVAIIVSNGEPVAQQRTTIADITGSPWKILREGAVPAELVMNYHHK